MLHEQYECQVPYYVKHEFSTTNTRWQIHHRTTIISTTSSEILIQSAN